LVLNMVCLITCSTVNECMQGTASWVVLGARLHSRAFGCALRVYTS